MIGRIVNSVRFKGLADFQYLQPAASAQKITAMTPYFQSPSVPPKHSNVDPLEQTNLFGSDSLAIPPILFSRFDIPFDYAYVYYFCCC